jgi:hypothetical protein
MSYDLFFYKSKSSNLKESQIDDYLTENLIAPNEQGNHWFFENSATGVYYIFEKNEPSSESEDIELYDSFPDFVNMHISFNLNFNRQVFFGMEAFQFVEQFTQDLGLYVLNPQDAQEQPYVPTKNELYENWNKTNMWASKDYFDEKTGYYPLEKATKVWRYNYGKEQLQAKVGEAYFVARIFFFRRISDGKVFTFSMWPEHIPTILPKTDYYLLGREYKKFFRTVKDQVLLSSDIFNEYFDEYFDNYEYEDSLIIHPQKAASVRRVFNKVSSDLSFEQSFQRMAVDSIVNVLPDK